MSNSCLVKFRVGLAPPACQYRSSHACQNPSNHASVSGPSASLGNARDAPLTSTLTANPEVVTRYLYSIKNEDGTRWIPNADDDDHELLKSLTPLQRARCGSGGHERSLAPTQARPRSNPTRRFSSELDELKPPSKYDDMPPTGYDGRGGWREAAVLTAPYRDWPSDDAEPFVHFLPPMPR